MSRVVHGSRFIEVDLAIDIDLSAESLWDFLMDPANQGTWERGVISVIQEPEGAIGIGTRFSETRRMLGKRFQTTFELIEFTRPTSSEVHVLSGPFDGGGRWELEQHRDGKTRFTFVAWLDSSSGFFKFPDRVLSRFLKHTLQQNCARLQQLVDADAGDVS